MIIITKTFKRYLKCKEESQTYPKSPLPEIITISILVNILSSISLVCLHERADGYVYRDLHKLEHIILVFQ